MEKILYPEIWHDEIYTTLWDIESKSPLARVKYYIYVYNDPLWSQDGSDVLLLSLIQDQRKKGGEEWFLVTDTGDVRQVTQFFGGLQDNSYNLSRPSRSKDGRFLVFQFTNEQPEKIAKYILLNLKTSTLEGYCIPLGVVENPDFASPAWAPDSKYFVIPDTDRYNNGDIVLVDAEGRTSYKIAEDMEVIGWIVKP